MNRNVLHKIEYGLYIVSSFNGEKLNGQIANTVFQVTADPCLLAVCLHKENLTNEYVAKSKKFSISILSEEAPMTFIGRFGFKSGKDIDKFSDTKYRIAESGVPIVEEFTVGYIDCKVINEVDLGTHTLFIGEMIDGDILDETSRTLTYSNYHKIKRGKTPPKATTFISNEDNKIEDKPQKKEKTMDKYVCQVCGYIYDPEIGDPDNGIVPGTSFEDLPDDWICPLCGVDKSAFEKE